MKSSSIKDKSELQQHRQAVIAHGHPRGHVAFSCLGTSIPKAESLGAQVITLRIRGGTKMLGTEANGP